MKNELQFLSKKTTLFCSLGLILIFGLSGLQVLANSQNPDCTGPLAEVANTQGLQLGTESNGVVILRPQDMARVASDIPAEARRENHAVAARNVQELISNLKDKPVDSLELGLRQRALASLSDYLNGEQAHALRIVGSPRVKELLQLMAQNGGSIGSNRRKLQELAEQVQGRHGGKSSTVKALNLPVIRQMRNLISYIADRGAALVPGKAIDEIVSGVAADLSKSVLGTEAALTELNGLLVAYGQGMLALRVQIDVWQQTADLLKSYANSLPPEARGIKEFLLDRVVRDSLGQEIIAGERALLNFIITGRQMFAVADMHGKLASIASAELKYLPPSITVAAMSMQAAAQSQDAARTLEDLRKANTALTLASAETIRNTRALIDNLASGNDSTALSGQVDKILGDGTRSNRRRSLAEEIAALRQAQQDQAKAITATADVTGSPIALPAFNPPELTNKK